jgi:hypothetical protein
VKPEKKIQFIEFITASKVLVIPRLFLVHFERDLWLTFSTNFKQIPDFFFAVSSIHNMATIYKPEALKVSNELLNINHEHVLSPSWMGQFLTLCMSETS